MSLEFELDYWGIDPLFDNWESKVWQKEAFGHGKSVNTHVLLTLSLFSLAGDLWDSFINMIN